MQESWKLGARLFCIVALVLGPVCLDIGDAAAQAPSEDTIATLDLTVASLDSGAVRGATAFLPVTVSVHQPSIPGLNSSPYAAIATAFSNALLNATDGGLAISQVTFVLSGQQATATDTANIVWQESGVPSLRRVAGFGTDGGHIAMFDVFTGGGAGGTDIDLLAPANHALGGNILAHLFLQYLLGVSNEYVEMAGDVAVPRSLLADPFAAAANGPAFQNISARRDGDPTPTPDFYEHTFATSQHRLQGASAWSTIARTYGEDPKSGRLIATRPRTALPFVAAAAPVGTSAPTANDGLVAPPVLSAVPSFGTQFQLFTDTSLAPVSGARAGRVAETGSRTLDITPDPVEFQWHSDSTLTQLFVSITDLTNFSLDNLSATLLDPLGRERIPAFTGDSQVAFDVAPNVVGRWRLILQSRALELVDVSVEVLGVGTSDTPRLMVDLVNAPGLIASNIVEFPEPAVFQANLTAGLGIRNAMVRGTVTDQTGFVTEVEFVDTGRSPDVIAGDGVYSAEYRYVRSGNHILEVIATNEGNTAARTYTGASLAPGTNGTSAVRVATPADEPFGEPFVRTRSFTFNVSGVVSDDHGNTALEATPIGFDNGDVAGRIDTNFDTDFFSFFVPVTRGAMTDVALRLTEVSGSGRPVFRLYASDGTTLLATATTSPSGYQLIARSLAAGGPYFLEVAKGSAELHATYSVSAGRPIASDSATVGLGAFVGAPGGGGGGGGGCFIATAAYGTPLEPRIDLLRDVRDRYLLSNPIGMAFSDTYYRVSPAIAERIADIGFARAIVRQLIWLGLAIGTYPLVSLTTIVLAGVAAVRYRGARKKAVRA